MLGDSRRAVVTSQKLAICAEVLNKRLVVLFRVQCGMQREATLVKL